MEDKTTIIPSELGKLLLGRPTIVTPKIIEEGKEIVRPDVVDAVTQLAILGQLAKIRKSLQRQEYEGKEDPRTLNATDQLQWIDLIDRFPNTPWAYAYFVNDGPDPVALSLDQVDNEFLLGVNETWTVSRTHAEERIRTIYYKCATGETASVRVVGQY